MQFTYWDLVLGVNQRIFAQASQPNNVILVTLMLINLHRHHHELQHHHHQHYDLYDLCNHHDHSYHLTVHVLV